MMKFYDTFQIPTKLSPEIIKEKFAKLIDFNHKKKVGENWIKKSFYGDYVAPLRLEIWNKTGIGTGIGDKKMSPKIKIGINAEYLNFEIVDSYTPVMRIIFFLILFALLISTSIHMIKPFENNNFFYGYIFCAFIGLGYLINRSVFIMTVKKTKDRFEKLFKE
jgi:hypothetical protein